MRRPPCALALTAALALAGCGGALEAERASQSPGTPPSAQPATQPLDRAARIDWATCASGHGTNADYAPDAVGIADTEVEARIRTIRGVRAGDAVALTETTTWQQIWTVVRDGRVVATVTLERDARDAGWLISQTEMCDAVAETP